MRLALGIEYNGAHFHGWQKQPGKIRTVQGDLERGLSKVANEPINVICAGRTDARVHGLAQVIHFETSAVRKEIAWVFGANSFLPPDIRVLWVEEVSDEFHARFSATARTYEYIILNSASNSALWHQLITWECRPLNAKAMYEAGQYLVGTHDFSSFRAALCQAKTPVRTLEYLTIEQNQAFIKMKIKANAFLHHMVRNIAGTLMEIGKGQREPIWMQKVLDAKDRQAASRTAPANGLYLCKVDYPDGFLSQNVGRYPNY